MKKRVIFITLFLLLFTVVSMAQSTYLLPWRGATHTYTATVTDAGNDNPVRWYVTTDAAGTIKADTTTDFKFITSGYSEPDSALSGTAVYSVDIEWGTTVAEATNFYVYIEVDDDASGCTNTMSLHVQIAADFNAVAWDVTGSATPGTVDPDSVGEDVEEISCPGPIEDPLWDGSDHTDIGYSELVYRVDRQFSILAWQFEYQLSEGTSQSFNLENITFVDAGGTELYNGTNLTGTINVDSDEDYVLVYVQITNQQAVTLDFDFDLITANNLTKDSDDNLDSNSADNSADHIIQPMPAITGFGGN